MSLLAFVPILLAVVYRIFSLLFISPLDRYIYNARSTAFKNSTTFFMASSSEDPTVFSHAIRALIPNSLA